MDTGVDVDHPEYRHALLPGYDFVDILDGAQDFIGDYLGADPIPEDEVGHGTHVAGIVAGTGKNMPRGVAPRCRVLPVRVLAAMSKEGRPVGAGLVENINNGVKWAIDHGADVINMSLGVRHSGGGLPHAEVIDYAQRKGVTVVAASGNDGHQALYYPGAFPSVIAVGAADDRGEVAEFSTFGDHVSFIAPGVDVYSSSLEDGYAFSTGTSHAAPFVTGAVALMKSYARSQGRELHDGQAKHVLKYSSDKVDRQFKNAKAGYGRLNLGDGLRYLDYKLNSARRPSDG
jgi:subtilisin family serine protease